MAAGPSSPGPLVGQPPNDRATNTWTPEQQAKYDAKRAVAARVADQMGAGSGDATIMAALPPCESECPPSTKILSTHARQQSTSYFCGPASAQVAINLSRGYFYTAKNGERANTNWKTQSKIAEWAKTTPAGGTSGANLEAALNRNNAVLPPTPSWIYAYVATGDLDSLLAKVVTDVHSYGMPLILPVRPHQPDKRYFLESWPDEIAAWHWILLRGYIGLTASAATISYNDSAEGYWGGTGAYQDTALTVWKVNHFSSDMIIW